MQINNNNNVKFSNYKKISYVYLFSLIMIAAHCRQVLNVKWGEDYFFLLFFL